MRLFKHVMVVGVVVASASTAYADGWSTWSVGSSYSSSSSWSVSSASADEASSLEASSTDASSMGAWQLSDGAVAEGASVMLAATDGDYGASPMMVEATPAETQVSGFDGTGAVPMLAYVHADPY